MTIAVRTALAADAPAVARVRLASWRAAYAHLLPAAVFDAMDAEDGPRRVLARMAGGATLLVGPATGAVWTFVNVGPTRDTDVTGSEIYAIYALPAAFGTGLGAALMTAAVARAARPLTLWVLVDNPRARRFYARHGFVPDRTRRDIDIGGTVLPEMRYRFAPDNAGRQDPSTASSPSSDQSS